MDTNSDRMTQPFVSRACLAMNEEPTTAVVQRRLDALQGDAAAEPLIRDLLERAVGRLRLLCASLLQRSYPRLTQPPLNLETDELLGGVVAGLLKALREVRPQTVRQFFALANQHMRWQLNDLARRLDDQPRRRGPGGIRRCGPARQQRLLPQPRRPPHVAGDRGLAGGRAGGV